jgi:hypothetical protein
MTEEKRAELRRKRRLYLAKNAEHVRATEKAYRSRFPNRFRKAYWANRDKFLARNKAWRFRVRLKRAWLSWVSTMAANRGTYEF